MEFREIIAPTMKELFKQELTRQILSGECEIGEKLPTEREMEKNMKVSRTVINTALTELADIGLVDIIPRHGVYVADYLRKGNIDTLIEIMHFKKDRLDKKTFNALVDYRYQAEVECAYLASQCRKDKDIVLMRQLVEQLEQETDYRVVAKLKVDFHHILYCATGNMVYPMVYNSFRKLSLRFNEIMYKHYGATAGTDYLYDLVDAIEAKDGVGAKAVAAKMVAGRVNDLKEYYFDIMDKEIDPYI